MERKLPYYMAYPTPLLYDDERIERRDLEYMKSMYPDTAKRALHYVEDYVGVVQNVHRMLRPGGVFLFSCEHPVFTAEGSQDWTYNPDGSIAHFPVDNYYCEGEREAVFLGERVVKYHRTLTTYLETLLRSGFALRHVVEPRPPEEMMDLPGMRDEMRRPMMLLVSAEKI